MNHQLCPVAFSYGPSVFELYLHKRSIEIIGQTFERNSMQVTAFIFVVFQRHKNNIYLQSIFILIDNNTDSYTIVGMSTTEMVLHCK